MLDVARSHTALISKGAKGRIYRSGPTAEKNDLPSAKQKLVGAIEQQIFVSSQRSEPRTPSAQSSR